MSSTKKKSDIEEQASGYLAVFWNENANCSVCKVVFASIPQATEWARKALERHGFKVSKANKSGVTALAGNQELGYRFIPMVLADEDTCGCDVSFDHMERIR